MIKIAAFFRLVRWPNLVFILLTQFLFEYCIYARVYQGQTGYGIFDTGFFMLAISSVLIAAGGYIINDYFDLNIDEVNKPDRVIVSKIISRRWIIFWHMAVTITGLCCVLFFFPFKNFWHVFILDAGTALLLWLYSVKFKKELLVGNVLIALLTSCVIWIVFLSKHPLTSFSNMIDSPNDIRFFRLTVLYTAFSFIISLIREAVKDMEDIEGDRKYGCRTMPIVWGMQASRIFVAVWLVVLIAVLSILQFYVLAFGWWQSILYCIVFLIVPLVWVLIKLFHSNTAKDFRQLSSVIKWIMLAGILSMLFFQFYL